MWCRTGAGLDVHEFRPETNATPTFIITRSLCVKKKERIDGNQTREDVS